MPRETYADILLPLALPETLTYRLPEELCPAAKPGQRVMVHLGKKKILAGLIWRIHFTPPSFEARDIIRIIDEAPILDDRQFTLWEWIAGYYLCTPGEVMKAALPAFLKVDNRDPKRIRKPQLITDNSYSAKPTTATDFAGYPIWIR